MLLFLHHTTGLFQWILEAYWHCIEKYSVLSEYFFLDASNFHTTHFQHHNTQLFFMGYQQTSGILASSPTCQLNCSHSQDADICADINVMSYLILYSW